MTYSVTGQEISQWRNNAKKDAITNNIPLQDIDWLLKELTNLDALSLRLNNFQGQDKIKMFISLAELNKLWQLRVEKRLPVQYLLGKCHWRNFTLKVGPDVLIPRPETELMIDLAAEAVKHSPNPNLARGNWVDLGTGSGAIAFGLREIFPQGTIYAVDVSEKALTIAKENALKLNLSDQISFYQGSWWQPLAFLQGKVSGIVSNPPYIPTQLIPNLQLEVVQHEPHLALDGGKDGLDDIRYLIKTAPLYLVSGGVWLMEIMAGQADLVVNLLENKGCFTNINVYQDLAAIERFVFAYLR